MLVVVVLVVLVVEILNTSPSIGSKTTVFVFVGISRSYLNILYKKIVLLESNNNFNHQMELTEKYTEKKL